MNIPSQDYHDFIDSLKEDADRRGDEARECEQDRLIHEEKIAELERRIAAYAAFVEAGAEYERIKRLKALSIAGLWDEDFKEATSRKESARAALDEWHPR